MGNLRGTVLRLNERSDLQNLLSLQEGLLMNLQMRNKALVFAILAGVILVLYLSWMAQPNIGTAGFILGWVAEWADAEENETIRTGFPFVLLGFLLGTWHYCADHSCFWWAASWFGLVSVVLLAEAGQLLLEKRSFDWLDVFWGATGALAGLVLSAGNSFLACGARIRS